MPMKLPLYLLIACLALISCSKQGRREVVFIDDVRQSYKQYESLSDSDVISCKVYPPGMAPDFYCKSTDSIVIVVKTKKVEKSLQQERFKLLNLILDSVDNGANILIVVDGILYGSGEQVELRNLPSDTLSSVDTLPFLTSKYFYGKSARPITMVINTYGLKYEKHH